VRQYATRSPPVDAAANAFVVGFLYNREGIGEPLRLRQPAAVSGLLPHYLGQRIESAGHRPDIAPLAPAQPADRSRRRQQRAAQNPAPRRQGRQPAAGAPTPAIDAGTVFSLAARRPPPAARRAHRRRVRVRIRASAPRVGVVNRGRAPPSPQPQPPRSATRQ
jgi:hypothetical protein